MFQPIILIKFFKIKIKNLVVFQLLFFSFNFFSQRISNLNLYQINNSVDVKFTVLKGPSCNGYSILHSLDDNFYSIIYNDLSICGTSLTDEDKSWLHNNPAFNQVNFYKVQLNPGEISPAKQIFVTQQAKAALTVFPDPIFLYNESLNLRILSSNNLRLIGFICDEFGYPLIDLDVRLISDTASLSVNSLRNGIYVIWLTDGNIIYSSKFIILR